MGTRLRQVPDAPPRALGLVRVSDAGDRGDDLISPELQETAIVDHCARRGYTLLRPLIVGIDESGSRARSKWWAKLDQAVRQVEAGDADVLVVWRFSRAARQRLRWAIAIDRVETAGGLLESATEPLDTSTASGRLARGMLSEFAAYEAETIGNTWREVHARRTTRGLPANGKPRFGYRVLDGVHRPFEPEASVLAALYSRYIAGESIYSLVSWLNSEGWRTVPGYSKTGPGAWTQVTLRRCLDTGFAAGYLTVHGSRQRGIHEPVIDTATWEAYLAARAGRRTHRRSERSQYLLSGLVRCMHPLEDGPCGSFMGAGQFGQARQPKFRCHASHEERRHAGGYVTMRLIEAEVMRFLQRLAGDVEASTDATVAQAARRARRKHDADHLAREVLRLDNALTQLEVNRASSPETPRHVFDAARDELLGQRKLADERRIIALTEARAGEPPRIAARLLADWELLPLEQRRGALRSLIAGVEVVPRRPVSDIRVVPAWLGE